MGFVVKIDGIKQLEAKLESFSKANKTGGTVTVSYNTKYAVKIHEDLTLFHRVGMAKYLEIPFRINKQKMIDLAATVVKNKKGVMVGLTRAGILLKEESQKLVPVDTGALRDSCKVVVTTKKLG